MIQAYTIMIRPKTILAALLAFLALTGSAQALQKFMKYPKWGYKNAAGGVVIKPKYNLAEEFSEGLAAVAPKYDYGFIDETGQMVIKPGFADAGSFSEGLAGVRSKKEGLWGYIDKQGNTVVPFIYQQAFPFHNGKARVKINDKFGVIDRQGAYVLEPIYYSINATDENGRILFGTNGLYGLMDENLNVVVNPEYSGLSVATEWSGMYKGMYYCTKTGLKGVIDQNGAIIVPPVYTELKGRNSRFFYGTIVKDDGKKENVYIDMAGLRYPDNHMFSPEDFAEFDVPLSEYVKKKAGTWESFISKGTFKSKESVRAAIESKLTQWQTKGEFESLDQWKKRVNDQTRQAKAKEISAEYAREYEELQKKYEQKCKQAVDEYCKYYARLFRAQDFELMPYDADNQTFLIKTSRNGDILLPVSRKNAQRFKKGWKDMVDWEYCIKATYVPSNDRAVLKSVAFEPLGWAYGGIIYDANTKADYAMVDVEYDFRPIDIESGDLTANFEPLTNESETKGLSKMSVSPETRKVKVGDGGGKAAASYASANTSSPTGKKSQVDTDIPQGSAKAENTFAVIIANSNYDYASNVECAANDGTVIGQYFARTLGIPEKQIYTYRDATVGKMAQAMSKLQQVAKAYSGSDFKVIYYYVGHGFPTENGQNPHLLPVDADPSNPEYCVPLNKLYEDLGALGASQVTVLLDACFSGAGRDDELLVKHSLGVKIKPRPADPRGNMFVLSAAQSDQTAYPYFDEGHDLFTYFILKHLQESKGDTNLGKLSEYVCSQVKKTSIKENGKLQEPSGASSPGFAGWQTQTLQ